MPNRAIPPEVVVAARPIELRPRGDFVQWLASSGGSLAISTYNAGKLAFLSAPQGVLQASFWKLPRPMGLAVRGRWMAVATQRHLSLYRLALAEGGRFDDLVHSHKSYGTGLLDAHDVAFDRRGLLLANTRNNCVARPSERARYVRHWQPAFVPNRVRRDCCHLNGLGMARGRLAMATAFCESDAPSAWRDGDRYTSGVLVDVPRNQTVVRGLCMPHSPRRHGGRWWLCDSGRGTVVVCDGTSERCETVAALPGFTRGLTFAEGRGIVGLSRIRKRHVLDAPPVRERWKRLRAGVALVDVHRGVETGSVEFVRGGREVYDVVFVPRAQYLQFDLSTDEPTS